MAENTETDIGWYVSDVHCRRAIGYLWTKLNDKMYLETFILAPNFLDLWGEALEKTMDVNEPSPIGPESRFGA